MYMESFIVIAVLLTVVSAYLLRQYYTHSLEVDDAPRGDPATERETPGDLKAA
jgi:hypothetical protein